MKNYKFGTRVRRVFVYLALIIIVALCVIPIWILIVNATRDTYEIQRGLSLLPSDSLRDNWDKLTGRGFSIERGFLNSIIISVSSTVLTVYFSVMTAYAIKVYDFKYKKIFYVIVLALVLIPTQVGIVGFRQYMGKLGLLNTYWPLILPAIAAPPSVFFAKQYLDSLFVKDLIYAARIDGASELGIFHRIMFPIAAPGAFTLGIFAFVASWNNFFTPFMLISKLEMYTLPMLIKTLRGDVYRTEYGSIYLGLAISIVPIMIVYAFFSRYIISGIAMGAIKE